MSSESSPTDPLDFIRRMWSSMGFSLPGLVTPTLDVNEIEKRIADLKAVEGWLRMNLNTLQISIHGLEMQLTTLTAIKVMTKPGDANEAPLNPLANPALWPWNFLQTQKEESAPADGDDTGDERKRRRSR